MEIVYVVLVLNLIKLHTMNTYGRGNVASYILTSSLDGPLTPGKELDIG
jgi:hypothetical protein